MKSGRSKRKDVAGPRKEPGLRKSRKDNDSRKRPGRKAKTTDQERDLNTKTTAQGRDPDRKENEPRKGTGRKDNGPKKKDPLARGRAAKSTDR